MTLLTLSSKGQITLPAAQRRKLGLSPHDRIISECVGDAIVIRRARSFFEFEGCIGQGLPIEEEERLMQEAAIERALGLEK